MKRKGIVLIIILILILSAGAFNVYAAYIEQLSLSGSLEFEAYGIDIDIDGTITGAVGEGVVTTYSATSNKTRNPDRNLISSMPWNFGNLKLEDSLDFGSRTIKIELTVKSYSSCAIEGTTTVSAINGATIELNDIPIIYPCIDQSLPKEGKITIIIKPSDLLTTIPSTALNISVDLRKKILPKEIIVENAFLSLIGIKTDGVLSYNMLKENFNYTESEATSLVNALCSAYKSSGFNSNAFNKLVESISKAMEDNGYSIQTIVDIQSTYKQFFGFIKVSVSFTGDLDTKSINTIFTFSDGLVLSYYGTPFIFFYK